jgi:hypothetical protein
VTGLVAEGVAGSTWRLCDWKIVVALGLFMIVGILTKLSQPGLFLKDVGVPLISMVGLMLAGFTVLLHDRMDNPATQKAAAV